MLYRILTEDKNREQVLKLVAEYLIGATVIQAKGLWMENWENTLIIEISGSGKTKIEIAVKALAEAIKKLNEQEVVLIQQIDCESCLI